MTADTLPKPEPCPEVPEWVWTSNVVLGWCDSSGCESLGHKGNQCKLAIAFAAHLRSYQKIRDAKAEAYEDAARIADEQYSAYPIDVFPEPGAGRHGTVDTCSARAARHTAKTIARLIRAAIRGGE